LVNLCSVAELYSYTEYPDFALNKQAFTEHFAQYGECLIHALCSPMFFFYYTAWVKSWYLF